MKMCSFDGCDRQMYAHRLCNPHNLQRRRGQILHPLRVRHATLIDRFMSKVDLTETCWLWTGRTTPFGYGLFDAGPNEPAQRAHRVSWSLHFGSVPPGMFVLHDCPDGDNPRCVNPDHLFLGDHDTNMSDMVAKDRQAKGVARRTAKLTDDAVARARTLHSEGLKIGELAERFGVMWATMQSALRRETWKHVE